MPVGLDAILAALQQGTQAINALSSAVRAAFPQVSATSTSATTGGISFNSSQPALFLSVTTSSGGTYKIPMFNS